MTKNQIAFIFARGGSKGIPQKNVREVGGKPLIAHSIEVALKSSHIKEVIVSTDDQTIAAVSKKYGAKILNRPTELAGDTSPEILSWHHAINHYRDHFSIPGTMFISLPATSPLRSVEDIDNAVRRLSNGGCDIVFGISPSHRNPYLNMVEVSSEKLIKVAIQGKTFFRRQDVPKIFDVTTCVYVGHTNYIESCQSLMEGRVGYVEIPAYRALDIDEEYDLYLADLQLRFPFGLK